MAIDGSEGHSDTGVLELDYKSREMIADELCLEIRKRYGSKRDIQIEVSEDNENGWSILSQTIKMTIYIVDIEAVDTRYTKQWKEHPTQLKRATNIDVKVISGGEVPGNYNLTVLS